MCPFSAECSSLKVFKPRGNLFSITGGQIGSYSRGNNTNTRLNQVYYSTYVDRITFNLIFGARTIIMLYCMLNKMQYNYE